MANIVALPDDDALVAAVGRVAISHGQLDYVLRLTVKTILDLPLSEARDATRRQSSQELRKRVRKLAEKRIGEGIDLVKLDALLRRAEKVTEQRNRLFHNICYQDRHGQFLFKDDNLPAQPYPTIDEVNVILGQIVQVAEALNVARKHGFLQQAIAKVQKLDG